MITGLDTGYFRRPIEGNGTAVQVWRQMMEGKRELAVSALSFFELHRMMHSGRVEKPDVLCRKGLPQQMAHLMIP